MRPFGNWFSMTEAVWVPPARTPKLLVRSDEPGVWSDKDDDHLRGFDELARFCLNPLCKDTDADEIDDGDENLSSSCTGSPPSLWPCL